MEVKTRELDKETSMLKENPFSSKYKFLIPNYFLASHELTYRSVLLALNLVNYSIAEKKLSNNISFSLITKFGGMPTSYSAAPSVFVKKTKPIIDELSNAKITIDKKELPLFSNIIVNYNLQFIRITFNKSVIIELMNNSDFVVDYEDITGIPAESINLYFTLLTSKTKKVLINKEQMYKLFNLSTSYRPTVVAERYLDPFVTSATSIFSGLTCTMNLVHKRLKNYEFTWN